MQRHIIQHTAFGYSTQDVIGEADWLQILAIDALLNSLQISGWIINKPGFWHILPEWVIAAGGFEWSILFADSASKLNQPCDVGL